MNLLKGVRVLDLTRLLPGPYATLLLADLGAEVIKIEEPASGDPIRFIPPFWEGQSARFSALNRGKKSVTLNLKQAEGQKLFLRLAETADVIVEGFRPGVAKRLGIDYTSVKSVKPEIVYCALSGYGQEGPYAEHVGHDINYEARAGLLSLTGAGQPTIPSVPVADLAGAMYAVVAILAALRIRDQGLGVFIDVSLTDAAVSWLAIHLAEAFTTNQPVKPQEAVLTGGFPCYHLYETKDGRFLAVGALEEKFWARLCERLGLPEHIPHQFSLEDRDEVFAKLREVFRSKTLAEWCKVLDPQELPVSPVLDLREVLEDPHLRARGLFSCPPGVAFPVRLTAEGPPAIPLYPEAPKLGEHTREVLSHLGLSASELERLQEKGII